MWARQIKRHISLLWINIDITYRDISKDVSRRIKSYQKTSKHISKHIKTYQDISKHIKRHIKTHQDISKDISWHIKTYQKTLKHISSHDKTYLPLANQYRPAFYEDISISRHIKTPHMYEDISRHRSSHIKSYQIISQHISWQTVTSFECRWLRLNTRKCAWKFGDSRENVFDMYGDFRENSFETLAVVIIWIPISSFSGSWAECDSWAEWRFVWRDCNGLWVIVFTNSLEYVVTVGLMSHSNDTSYRGIVMAYESNYYHCNGSWVIVWPSLNTKRR